MFSGQLAMAKNKNGDSAGVQFTGDGTSRRIIASDQAGRPEMTNSESPLTNSGSKDEGKSAAKKANGDIAAGIVQSMVPAWMNAVVITLFIFGGCCSNVI